MQCLECSRPLRAVETKGQCAPCILKWGNVDLFTEISDAEAPELPPSLLFPFEFGNYRVLRLLGAGGMGAVYEVEVLEDGRRIAMKVLSQKFDSTETRERFLREGRIAAAINHPNCVYVFGTEEIDGTPVITMELVAGGTLHDWVTGGGPQPVGRAVDAILQVIAGLEVASNVGILHRDIKPQNCFVEQDGTVKVGDFGLAVSADTRLQSRISVHGSGTPIYAAPEQRLGEEADLRADIYSVGATLHCLLHGRPPSLKTAGSPHAAPAAPRAEIPQTLVRVVQRCLEKSPDDRFGSYNELRRALLPFASTAPIPAPLTRRFLAGVLDHAALFGMNVAITLVAAIGYAFATHRAPEDTPFVVGVSFCLWLAGTAYYGVPEGLWGASLGKAILGLRVNDHQRNMPGIPRATLRALIYLLPMQLAFVPFTAHTFTTGTDLSGFIGGAAFFYLYPALLCATARRRNGFATATDLLTRTRVVVKRKFELRIDAQLPEEPVADVEALSMIGPYRVLARPAMIRGADFLLGYDPRLRRRVWIREVQPATPAVPLPLRKAARPGRLRWLLGRRRVAEAWDAYECAPGTPLLEILRVVQPWERVRRWFYDLAVELDAARRDGTMPAELRLDRVWITNRDRVKLLDFDAPGIESPMDTDGVVGAGIFLNQVAISALTGRVVSGVEARTGESKTPLGFAARRALREARNQPAGCDLAPLFRPLLHQIPEVSRRRRLVLLAGSIIPGLYFSICAAGLITASAFLHQHYPDFLPMKIALYKYARAERGSSQAGFGTAGAAQPWGIYIADRFRKDLHDPSFLWLMPAERAAARGILAAYSSPSSEEVQRARAALGTAIDKQGDPAVPWIFEYEPDDLHMDVWCAVWGCFFWPALFSLGAALVFRGGVVMHAAGVGVAREDGTEASHGRTFWRACIAWSPMAFAFIIFVVVTVQFDAATAGCLTIALVVTTIVWSAALPSRGLPDRLAGTWLVPR